MYRINKCKMRKYICLFVTSLIVFLSGCNHLKVENSKSVSATGFYFDTTIQLQIVHEDADALIDGCFELCQELELIFSRTNPKSELYQLNHRSESTVEVSDHLAYVISLGLEYSEKTDGIFDITICPVSDLWDFKSEAPQVPSDADIQNALKKVDYQKVHIDENTVIFDSEDTMLDLGAIAKGYAADVLKEYLVSNDVESGFINMGGNVQTIGTKTDGSAWNIGIQKPFTDRGTVLETVAVENQSVVSAGIYERYFELNGTLYYHILDPATGYPVKTDLNQVTVISDESALGDILSTWCLLMGDSAAQEFIQEIGFSNIWLHLDDQCAMIRQ